MKTRNRVNSTQCRMEKGFKSQNRILPVFVRDSYRNRCWCNSCHCHEGCGMRVASLRCESRAKSFQKNLTPNSRTLLVPNTNWEKLDFTNWDRVIKCKWCVECRKNFMENQWFYAAWGPWKAIWVNSSQTIRCALQFWADLSNQSSSHIDFCLILPCLPILKPIWANFSLFLDS